MKKQIITTLCISALLISSAVSAAEVSKTFKGINFNVKTPDVKVSNTAATKKAAANKAAMKAQISAINSKVNSTSATYNSAVNNLTKNLLPAEQLKKYNAEKAKLKTAAKNSNAVVNIEIAEDGTIYLNKYLKTSASGNTLQKLTAAQKSAIKNDLKKLNTVKGSYLQIAEQSKTLAKQIKADPVTAMELKADLTSMVKNEVKVTKQVKNISKLTTSVAASAAKAGISL